MSSARLPAPAGLWIDRDRRLSFQFNGQAFEGLAGDTLASALLAQGVRLVGRSFKLHRPRGIFSCGVEEPTGLVDVGRGAHRVADARATLVPLYAGLSAASINCWPSVGFDLGAVNGLLGRFLPAGFYYKTFMWPSWQLFEPTIRRMAGLGRAASLPDPDRYEELSASVDVLVVGAGAAGLAAAVAAAEAGADTLLLTGAPRTGGALGLAQDPEVAELGARAARLGVRMQLRTVAFGVYDHKLVCAMESLVPDGAERGGALRERLWKIRARSIIAATGAIERPVLFPGNDRPGVMLAHAALKYARGYGVRCGERAVIAANCDGAYPLAAALQSQGIEVAAIVERRPAALTRAAAPRDIRVLSGSAIASVRGARSVQGCEIAAVDGSGAVRERIACDLLLAAGGWTPAVHLHSQAGGRLRWVDDAAMFVPDGAAPGLCSVGACAGVFGRDAVLAHAAATGTAVARGLAIPAAPLPDGGRSLRNTQLPALRGKTFVDLQNDVTLDDVGLAARENYRSVEHLKRYTTTGMGTDQGKTSNVNALVAMGELTGREPPQVGTTRFRPPFTPVTIGALVGRRVGALYRPLKRLPAHDWHAERGALFEPYGDWLRPSAYPRAGESLEAAAQREAATVRRSAGLFDGSPLGKLEIFGPDAARFLDLMYLGTMSTLEVGQARYGLVLNENGVIADDGIVARMGPQRFWVNTTSAGVERTAAAFELWLQCEFTDLRVAITPVTGRWGNVTVAGPRAWEWLAASGFDPALAPGVSRHMSLQRSALDGIPLRVLRASFSGELGYEINLPVHHARALFERLWARAGEVGASLYGIEALEILRTEKGYLHVGTDTDGTTLPADVGLARGIARKSAAFVGRRSLSRPAAQDGARMQLVGLVPVDRRTRLPVGAQVTPHPPPAVTQGHVTSSYHSPTLGHPIALAMLVRGSERIGERIKLYNMGRILEAEVVKTPFFDPAGKRLNG